MHRLDNLAGVRRQADGDENVAPPDAAKLVNERAALILQQQRVAAEQAIDVVEEEADRETAPLPEHADTLGVLDQLDRLDQRVRVVLLEGLLDIVHLGAEEILEQLERPGLIAAELEIACLAAVPLGLFALAQLLLEEKPQSGIVGEAKGARQAHEGDRRQAGRLGKLARRQHSDIIAVAEELPPALRLLRAQPVEMLCNEFRELGDIGDRAHYRA